MAKITFNDGGGSADLRNAYPAPADRFSAWVPLDEPIGDTAERQSDGALSMFVFRTDYTATFELRGIASRKVAGVAAVDLARRLRAWLLKGGTCSVATEDADANTYPTCGLTPGSKPLLTLSDTVNIEYTLSLSLINLAGSPVPMVCRYNE